MALYKEIDNYCHQDPRIVSQDFDIFVAAFKHVNMERQTWDLYIVEIPNEREGEEIPCRRWSWAW